MLYLFFPTRSCNMSPFSFTTIAACAAIVLAGTTDGLIVTVRGTARLDSSSPASFIVALQYNTRVLTHAAPPC